MRAGLVPVFVDVEPNTFNVDVTKIEAMVTEKTGAILMPNLAGNCPDWDVIRDIADRHGLKVIEDSCDAIGATLRGTPTGSRADIVVTSFSMAHIITCAGTGGMVCVDDEASRDKALLLRRWGRRSEPNLFGSTKSGRVFREELDGVDYDNDFIFELMSWNFEPSELGAAYGVVQLDKLEENYKTRKATFAAFTAAYGAPPRILHDAGRTRRSRHGVAVLPGDDQRERPLHAPATCRKPSRPTVSTHELCGAATSLVTR